MKAKTNSKTKGTYFIKEVGLPIRRPKPLRVVLSRLMLPVLSLLSREQSLKTGLVPLDDERVIQALKFTKGKALDVGCGANNYIKSYGNGIGVDVYPWEGVDMVVKDAGKLPFKNGEFRTVAFLACLNHIPNRADALLEANRVLEKDGILLVTMIPPLWGRFIHWLRFRNDPDHQDRDIDHDHELLGMHTTHVRSLIKDAGFDIVRSKTFVYGINRIYIAKKV